jgi:hypothetical protein
MFRQIGATLGVAAFVAILGTPAPDQVLGAYDETRWFMLAATAVAALALMPLRLRTPAQSRQEIVEVA